MGARMSEDVNPAEWREHLYCLTPERWASLKGKSFWVTGGGDRIWPGHRLRFGRRRMPGIFNWEAERKIAGDPGGDFFLMNPYIDQEVRVKRMKKVYETLRRHGVAVGAYAEFMVDKTEKELGSRKGPREGENQTNRDGHPQP